MSLETFLPQVAQYGLLGVLFVLAIIALYTRDKELTRERRERLEDAKAFSDVIQANTVAQNENVKQREEAVRELRLLSEKIAQLHGRTL